ELGARDGSSSASGVWVPAQYSTAHAGLVGLLTLTTAFARPSTTSTLPSGIAAIPLIQPKRAFAQVPAVKVYLLPAGFLPATRFITGFAALVSTDQSSPASRE